MWTKRDKRLEPLFVKPSSSHMEMTNYFHFHHAYPGQVLPTSTATGSFGSAPTVLWKSNSARRKRFEVYFYANFESIMTLMVFMEFDEFLSQFYSL
ncbi:Mitogen-activated protein kinase kinase kinase [Dirofilaria immitis]